MSKTEIKCPHCGVKLLEATLGADGALVSSQVVAAFAMRGAMPDDLTKARIECGACSTMFPMDAKLLNLNFTPAGPR